MKPAPDGPARDRAEPPIDIAVAVRAAKTAAAHGRAPAAQETAKMGAFELEQALAKLHVAGKEDAPRTRLPSMPTPAVELTPAAIEAKVEGGAASERSAEREEKPKNANATPIPIPIPIPIPEPSEPGPMVASIREPRPVREARGLPRSTLVLVVLAAALIAALYAWSRALR